MADVDIAVDTGDLKRTIDILSDVQLSFGKMVNQVQTDSNRLARASKATSDQVRQAWQRMFDREQANKLSQQVKAEESLLKRHGQTFKNILAQKSQDAKAESARLTQIGNAANAILQKNAEEEQRILTLRSQRYKQFFQEGFMKSPSAGSGGAPTSANDSALLQNEKALAAAADETARATKNKEREIALLTARYNPLLAAEQQYHRMQQEINRSLDMNIIDTKQQAAALNQLEKEYNALNSGVYLAGSRFNQFGQMAGMSGKAAQRFGMYAQQAGYQVGDFAVQLQSGANAGVAFSQQAAQLAGLIPGLAGALTTFAAIGVGLGIQAMIAFNESGREGKEIYEDLGSTLEALEGLTFDNITGSLSESAKTIRAEFQATFDLIERVETKALKDNLLQPLKEMERELQRYQERNQITNQLGGGDASFNYMGFTDPNSAIMAFQYLSDIQGETREELSKSLNLQTQYLQGSGLLTAEVQARLAVMAEELGVVDSVTSGVEEQLRLEEQIAEQRAKDTEEATKLLSTLEEEINMQKLISTYGKDSLIVKQAQLAAEDKVLRAMIDSLDIASGLKDELYEAADASYAAESATLSWADSMAAVNNQLRGAIGLLNSIGGGMIQSAGINAANQVLDQGGRAVDAERARRRAEEDAILYQTQDRLMAEGASSPAILAMEQEALARSRAAEDEYSARIESARESEREAAKAAKGGGGSKKPKLSDAEKRSKKAAEHLNEFFDEFELGMEQQERLIGVHGEQREELEKIIEIENRLGEARHLVSQAQIEAIAREELALENKLERERQIFEIGSSNVENLLMSVVDGTASIEDAFKAMLSNIIMEVYKSFVAEGAADLAGNALVSLFSAKGNAFGSGGVKMFAKGGVVDSPSLFGYGGGKTGMMGEAGPEAIMPLKRNTQGQLGVAVSGGGNAPIHVTNVFQMQANGDAAVKAIIMGEMPKIKEATKLAVVDASRRNRKGF